MRTANRWRPSTDGFRLRAPAVLGAVAVALGGLLLVLRGPVDDPTRGQLRIEEGSGGPPAGERAETQTRGSWRMLPDAPLSSRSGHVAVWTGDEVLVWGGQRHGQSLTDGAAYDPLAGAWRRLPATVGVNAGRMPSDVAAVWTGREMIVLGPASGLAYRPDDDAWRDLPPPPAGAWVPGSASWTGDEVVVLADGQERAAGYDPRTDRWRELPRPPVAADTDTLSVELLGTVVVVGPSEAGPAITRYDRRENVWSEPQQITGPRPSRAAADPVAGRVLLGGGEASTVSAWSPAGGWRALFALPEAVAGGVSDVVWTGDALLVWAGEHPGASVVRSAGFWRPLAPSPLPARRDATAVWTGEELLVWGGHSDGEPAADGAVFRLDARDGARMVPPPPPITPEVPGTWRRLPPGPLPAPPSAPTSVAWTGTQAVVLDEFTLARVAMYDPVGAVWRAGPEAPQPRRRVASTTVWTGEELVAIAAYAGPAGRPLDGVAYNPTTRSWRDVAASPTAPTAPVVAVWTGREVLVLAGHARPRALAYDPAADSWRELDAPPSRGPPAALAWTGQEGLALTGAGQLLRMDTDAGHWRSGADDPVATPPFPPVSSAWTGQEWVVLARRGGGSIDGAAYDPRTDAWRTLEHRGLRADSVVATGWEDHPLLLVGVEGTRDDAPPVARLYDADDDAWRVLPAPPPWLPSVHAAVWTGTQLLVWSEGTTAAAFTPHPTSGPR